MSDLLLIYPKTGIDVKAALAPPHSLLAVAALPDKMGMKVCILDQRIMNEATFNQKLDNELKENPLAIGISTMTGTQIKFAIDIAKQIKRKSNIPVIWGGTHPTLQGQQTLDSGYADAVCVGEGDYQFYYNVIENNFKGIWTTSKYANLDDLPDTPFHLINIENYIHNDMYLKNSPRTLDIGQTSRGCPFRCGFCCQGGKHWRAMSADKAIEMISKAVKNYNLTGIWLRDDEFYIDLDRAEKICKGIMKLGVKWYTCGTRIDIFNKTPDEQVYIYKESGAGVLKFGAESGSNRMLDLMNKKIHVEDTIKANLKAKKHGIVPAYNLVIGFPTQTFEEIDETIDLIKRLKKDNHDARFETMLTYAPMAGTPMWELAINNGFKPPEKLEDWINWRFDEYDTKGDRLAWYDKKERNAIGNLCYLTSLTFAIPNLLETYDGIGWKIMKILYKVPNKYFEWRFNNKSYRWMPELKIIKKARELMSY